MSSGNGASKAICTICFEDLRPIVEDLQVVPICGHVFHELCLQQWFEYCPSTKKQSCPICKQACWANKVCRLYFQSVGDANDAAPIAKSSFLEEEDPEVLHREVRRLESKVLGLNTALERRGKDLERLNNELCICKELLQKEAALKDDTLKQKTIIQQLLDLKSQELDKTTLECLRLQERNMALAKELAALKLVSDLDLEEDEVFKLASLGNEANTKDTIDILKKSLVIRNRSYKELMAKCNLLGRGEARSSRKLEKAKEKISKLKVKVQELETAIEANENEVLRALKASKKGNSTGDDQNGVNSLLTSNTRKRSPEDQLTTTFVLLPGYEMPDNVTKKSDDSWAKGSFKTKTVKNLHADCTNGPSSIISSQVDPIILVEENSKEFPLSGRGVPDFHLNLRDNGSDAIDKVKPSGLENSSYFHWEDGVHKELTSSIEFSVPKTNSDNNDVGIFAKSDDVTILDDPTHGQPTLNIRKETPSQLVRPGEICFSGGLLGPDGTTRYLGKWCKRGQNNKLKESENSRNTKGDLIAVGSDGRGGRVKALRPHTPSPVDVFATTTKRCKIGSKTSISPSQGCLQIEHFFRKTGH